MPDIPVESRSVNTVVELTVSAPFAGDGAAVDYSEPSLSVTLQSTTPTSTIYGSQDVLYRVDAGEWVTLPPGGKRSIAIDLSTQTLTMKRGQFASNVSVSMTVEGVPSGLYAGDTEIQAEGSGLSEEDLPAALAGLGVYANDIRSRTVTVTKADILALHTTPFELVPAVAGSVNWPIGFYAISIGAGGYDTGILTFFDIAFGTIGPEVFASGDSRLGVQVIAQGYTVMESGPTHDLWAGATLQPYVRGQPLLLSAASAITERTDCMLAVTIHTAGTNYAVGDILGGPHGTVLAVTSIGASGAVTGLFVVDGASSCIIESNKTTSAQTGSGTGCKINVTEVGNSNVTLEITTLYRLKALPWA